MKRKKYSLHSIARELGRSVSALSDEVRRNKTKHGYASAAAQQKSYVRRKYAKYQAMKIVDHPVLRKSVETKLWEDYSPEQVAGRIRRYEKHLPRISKNAIYGFLASVHGRSIEAYRVLRDKKRRKRKRRVKVGMLENRTFIEKRPQIIEKRGRVGDAEADFILSCKGGRGILLTLTDRRLRLPFIEKILPVSIPAVERALARIKRRFPELKTITFDNDILLQHHQRLEKILGVRVYFCHPYSSFEKGSIENTNGLIRRYIPKGSSIADYSRVFIRKIEIKLQNRPLKCLRYETPREALMRHRKRVLSSTTKKSPEMGCSD